MTRTQEDRYQMIAAIARRVGEGRNIEVGSQVDHASPMAGPGSHFRATVDAGALQAARDRCGRCGDTVRRCQCHDFVAI